MQNAFYIGLETAAKATGKKKSTILNAIKTGKISAEKEEKGRWKILKGELHRVYPKVQLTGQLKQETGNRETEFELIELRLKVQNLEEQNRMLKEDKEKWQQQAERVSLLLTHEQEKPPVKVGWFDRLLGRA